MFAKRIRKDLGKVSRGYKKTVFYSNEERQST